MDEKAGWNGVPEGEDPSSWEERGRIEGYAPGPTEGFEAEAWEAEEKPGGQAVAALVLGIVGLASSICCCGGGGLGILLSVLAWVLGHQELRAIERGRSPWSGYGRARAGMILGIVGTALNGLLMVGGFLYWVFMGAMMFASAGAPGPPS